MHLALPNISSCPNVPNSGTYWDKNWVPWTQSRGKVFSSDRPRSVMQDAKEFKLTYSQNTLGQPHLHKKGKERNERETKKKRKGTYEYVYRTFSTIRVFPESHFFWGLPSFPLVISRCQLRRWFPAGRKCCSLRIFTRPQAFGWELTGFLSPSQLERLY